MLARVSWMFAGTLLGNLSRFAFAVLLARQLGASEFGRFSLCALFALSVYTVLGIGLGDTAARFVAAAVVHRSRRNIRQTLRGLASAALVLGFVGGGVVVLASDYLARAWFDKPDLAPYLRAVAWSIPAGVAFVCASGIIQAFEAFRALNVVRNVTFPMLPLLLWLVVGGASGNIDDAILSWNIALVISGVAAVVCTAILYRRGSFSDDGEPTSAREQVSFAATSTVVGLLNVLQSWLDTLLLGRLANSDAVGRYGAATRLVQPIAMATFSFISVYYPRAASLNASGERQALQQLHHDTSRFIAITTALPYVGLVALGEPLLELFGDDFASAWLALVLYASGQMVLAATGPSGQLLMATGHQNGVVVATAAGVGASAVTAWLLIPSLGATGAGAAFFASMSAYAVSAMVQVRWIHGYWPWTARTARTSATTAVAVIIAVVLHTSFIGVPLLVASFLLVTGVLLVLLRVGLTSEERQQLRRKLRPLSA